MKWIILGITLAAGIIMLVPATRSVVQFAAWRVSTKAALSTGFASVDGVQIHYKSYGNGSPLVLLHGGLSSSWDWLGEIPTLAAKHHLIVVDMRGHGSSTIGCKPFTYRLLASDVVAVLDSLAIESADIAGWSDGGNVGLLIALEYPERIRKLIAISANYHPSGVTGDTLRQLSEHPTAAGSLWSRILYVGQSSAPAQWPQLQEMVSSMWQSYPQLEPEDLQRITSPTLVIAGENDTIEKEHSKAMAAAIPQADLLVLPGVGHTVPRDAPSSLLDHIDRFLSSTR